MANRLAKNIFLNTIAVSGSELDPVTKIAATQAIATALKKKSISPGEVASNLATDVVVNELRESGKNDAANAVAGTSYVLCILDCMSD